MAEIIHANLCVARGHFAHSETQRDAAGSASHRSRTYRNSGSDSAVAEKSRIRLLVELLERASQKPLADVARPDPPVEITRKRKGTTQMFAVFT